MARNVDVNVNANTENAEKKLKSFQLSLRNAGKSGNNASNDIAKGFLKAFATIEGIKKAFDFAKKSLEEFEKRAGKPSGFTAIQKVVDDIQAQVGSVLSPVMEELGKIFEKNRDRILGAVRDIADGVVRFGQAAYQFIQAIKSGIMGLFNLVEAGIGTVVSSAIKGVQFLIDQVNNGLKLLPDKFIPDSWIEGLEGASASLGAFTKAIDEEFGESADKAVQDFAQMSDAIKATWKILSTPPSVGIINLPTQAEIKAAEDRKKLREQNLKDIRNIEEREAQALIDNMQGHFQLMLRLAALDKQERMQVNTQFYNRLEEIQLIQYEREVEELEESYQKQLKIAGTNSATLVSIEQWKAAQIRGINRKLRDQEEKEVIEYTTFRSNLTKENTAKLVAAEQRYLDTVAAQDKSGYTERLQSIQAYQDESTKIYAAALKANVINQEQYNAFILELDRALIEERKAANEEYIQYQLSVASKTISAMQDVLGAVDSLFSTYHKYQLDRIDEEVERQKEAAKRNIRNKRDLEKAYAEIDKDAAARRRKLAKAEAAINIAQAIMNTAQAVIKAIADYGFPWGVVVGAIVGALGAAQVGIMVAQYAKMATGGIVQGDQTTGDLVPARLNSGEMVLNKAQQSRLFAIAEGRERPTGAATNITTGDTNIVINGNADIPALERALAQNRSQQIEDMRRLLNDMAYTGQLRMAA